MKIDLTSFWDECNSHDWFYQFTDDSVQYHKGTSNFDRLQRVAQNNGPKHLEMLQAFTEHYFTKVIPIGRVDKPTRPMRYN